MDRGKSWVDRLGYKVLDNQGVSNSGQPDSGQTCYSHTYRYSKCQYASLSVFVSAYQISVCKSCCEVALKHTKYSTLELMFSLPHNLNHEIHFTP